MLGRKHKKNAQEMAWLVRAAFELGYRAAKPETEPNEWRKDWIDSRPRDVILKMGYINKEDNWR